MTGEDYGHLVLWHAINVLREHRGDGHIAALQASGLLPAQSTLGIATVPAPGPGPRSQQSP